MKAFVHEVAYQPNKFANRQTDTIGLIIPTLNHVLPTIVNEIDEVALGADDREMVCQSDESFSGKL